MNENSAIHSIQMLEDGDDRSTDPMPSFAAYADDVRVFTVDAELIVRVQDDDNFWHITGSDHFNWLLESDIRFMTAHDAIEHALGLMGIPISELDDAL